MNSMIDHIVIRHDGSADVMLAGLPLLARVILGAVGEGEAAVSVVGDCGADYRRAVEKIVTQVAPDTPICWRADFPVLSDNCSGHILVITASGLFTADLVDLLRRAAGRGNAFAPAVDGDELGGLWLLDLEGYCALAKAEPVSAVRVASSLDNFCPVYNRETLQAAEKWLFKRFGKSTDGFVSRHLNRPISTWVSRRLVHTPVTPNILTLLTAASALLMYYVLQVGTPMMVAMGCLLYHVTSVVDGFDGEVARAKFLSTRWGATFDTAVDMATNILFIVGLTLGLAKIYGPEYLVLGGLVAVIALIGIASMTFVVWKGPKGGSFDVLQLTIRRQLMGWPIIARLFEVLNAIMKRDFFALLFGLLGIAGFAYVIPWILAVGMIAWLVAIILAAPLVIGADPSEILPDHIGPLAVSKNPQPTRPPGE